MKNKNNIADKSSPVLGGFCRLIYIFVFCAVLGWLWEEGYCLIKHGFWVERGFLFGPLLPIYGFGGVLINLLYEKLTKKPIPLFFTSIGIAGVVEYFSSWLLEKIFGKRWWDYMGEPFDINGRVEFIRLVFFGIAGALAVYFVIPLVLKLISKGNTRLMRILAYILFSAVCIDFIISCIIHLMA